jgi:hypothetical protein
MTARARTAPAAIAVDARVARREQLREALPATVDCLTRRRADLIDDRVVDDYIELNWLEWHGGGLRLTITGRNVCAQLAATARSAAN